MAGFFTIATNAVSVLGLSYYYSKWCEKDSFMSLIINANNIVIPSFFVFVVNVWEYQQ